jgi:hypothetical protein
VRSTSLLPLLACFVLAPAALAAQNDARGSSDHRLFPRIAGYEITSYRDADPVVEQFRNGQGLARDTVEGRVTTIAYALPRGGSQQPTPALGLVRYYEGIVQRLGGTVLFRQPVYGELTARLVQNGREFWLKLHLENTREYGIAIAERSAPARAAVVALAGTAGAAASCRPCAGLDAPSAAALSLLPASARRFRAAAARFALDTGWVPVVQPSRGTGDAIVTIRGLHIEDATDVRFGDTPGRILDRTASAIAVVVPRRPVGPVPVVVNGPFGARTARDSFVVYQEPISGGSGELRAYTCTAPPSGGAPDVTGLVPAAVRTGDTLVINGTMLDAVDHVSFTYWLPPNQTFGQWGRSWDDSGDLVSHLVLPGQQGEIAAWPIAQSATRLTVVVPQLARTGPVALFGYGACVLSDQVLAVRVGPAPR